MLIEHHGVLLGDLNLPALVERLADVVDVLVNLPFVWALHIDLKCARLTRLQMLHLKINFFHQLRQITALLFVLLLVEGSSMGQ